MYQNLVNTIPRKWHSSISKFAIEKENMSSFATVLSFLLTIIANGEQKSNFKSYMELFCKIFEDQFVLINDDPLESKNDAFSPTDLHIVISEFLGEVDKRLGGDGLLEALTSLIRVTNRLPQSTKTMELVHEGYLIAVKSTGYPLIFVNCACKEIASPERMSAVCEAGLTRYAFYSFNGWKVAQNSLIVPELDESMFIRHCLSHCFAVSLFVHARKKLDSVSSDEYLVIIGEQIGVWIESLNVEAASVMECKILLILYLFANLISNSVNNKNGDVSSRLNVHLVPIADTLFKWSEKHHVPSLWSALGYSSAKGLPANLRLICRYFSIFVASRMRDSKDWNQEFNSFVTDTDFAAHSDYLEKTIRPKFQDKNLKIRQFAQELSAMSVYFYGDSFSKLLLG